MDVASFLKKIGDVLSERRTSARELDALEFAADGRDVSIRVRSKPHGSLYPSLADILASIGRTCHDQGVALPQLSRIAFLSDEVRVELGSAGQQAREGLSFPHRRRARRADARTDAVAAGRGEVGAYRRLTPKATTSPVASRASGA